MSKLAMLGGTRTVPRGTRLRPWPPVTEADRAAVNSVLDSGRFTAAAAGEQQISSLEQDWARYTGVEHCTAVSNGTTALSVALAAAGVQPGDEVLVPALSFIATAFAPLHVLASPVFVDIDPVSYNIDAARVAAAITPRTSAIVPVHLHGLPADMDEIRAIAARHKLTVVEDAAQAQGATYRGARTGSLGSAASFSLNVSKNLGTCGEGGLVTTRSAALNRRATMFRQFGELIEEDSHRSYVSHLVGWNCKPSAVQCAFTRSQLARFEPDRAVRDRNVAAFLGRVSAIPGLVAPSAPGDRTHAWHILRFRVDPAAFGLDRASAGPLRALVMRALRAEGVPASHYQMMPLPGQVVFTKPRDRTAHPDPDRDYRGEDCPETFRAIDETFTIQKAHLHPEAGELLALYADAFEKLWDNRAELVRRCRTEGYQPPWAQAQRLAERESG